MNNQYKIKYTSIRILTSLPPPRPRNSFKKKRAIIIDTVKFSWSHSQMDRLGNRHWPVNIVAVNKKGQQPVVYTTTSMTTTIDYEGETEKDYFHRTGVIYIFRYIWNCSDLTDGRLILSISAFTTWNEEKWNKIWTLGIYKINKQANTIGEATTYRVNTLTLESLIHKSSVSEALPDRCVSRAKATPSPKVLTRPLTKSAAAAFSTWMFYEN